jgi:hypothetical protein
MSVGIMSVGSTTAVPETSQFRAPGRPVLRLVGPPPRTFWPRRLAVLLAALLLVAGAGIVLRAAGGSLTHEPPAAPASSPIAGDHVVQPGDTIWSVARRLQPEGDLRPLVDELVAVHGTGLVVGEVIDVGGR